MQVCRSSDAVSSVEIHDLVSVRDSQKGRNTYSTSRSAPRDTGYWTICAGIWIENRFASNLLPNARNTSYDQPKR